MPPVVGQVHSCRLGVVHSLGAEATPGNEPVPGDGDACPFGGKSLQISPRGCTPLPTHFHGQHLGAPGQHIQLYLAVRAQIRLNGRKVRYCHRFRRAQPLAWHRSPLYAPQQVAYFGLFGQGQLGRDAHQTFLQGGRVALGWAFGLGYSYWQCR